MKTKTSVSGDSSASNTNHDKSRSLCDSRRDFAKTGLLASGVLLTLTSRSALAGAVCKTASGFLSANLSNHGTPATCSGQRPNYWMANPTLWPAGYTSGSCVLTCTDKNNWSGGTAFSAVFDSAGTVYAGYTMMQVMVMAADPYLDFGACLVASALNVAAGLTPVLTHDKLVTMFSEWKAKGYYEPTAGVQWNSFFITSYLTSTMG